MHRLRECIRNEPRPLPREVEGTWPRPCASGRLRDALRISHDQTFAGSTLRVAARLLHKRTTSDWAPMFGPGFILQNAGFKEWSRWDSNPRPPPCKGGTMLCCIFPEYAKSLQTA